MAPPCHVMDSRPSRSAGPSVTGSVSGSRSVQLSQRAAKNPAAPHALCDIGLWLLGIFCFWFFANSPSPDFSCSPVCGTMERGANRSAARWTPERRTVASGGLGFSSPFSAHFPTPPASDDDDDAVTGIRHCTATPVVVLRWCIWVVFSAATAGNDRHAADGLLIDGLSGGFGVALV